MVDYYAIIAGDCATERIIRMKLSAKCCLSLAVLALSGSAAFSAELATLRNGFVVRVEHREARGGFTRFFTDQGTENFVDIPTDQIVSFETLPDPPALPEVKAKTNPVRTISLEEIVTTTSSRYGIDPDLILSLIRAESAFDPKAVSPKGAQGLMQLMPQTATLMGVEDPMDAAANVEGGTRYLRDLLALYHQDLIKALAAYNAGPARIQQYRGVPPYPETIKYITRIVRDLNRRKIANAMLIYKKSEMQKKESISKHSSNGSASNSSQLAEHRNSGLASAAPSPSL